MINSVVIFALIINLRISYCKPVGIVAFGEVGGGKSTLCNTLVGSHDRSAFRESPETEAQTMETVGKAGRFGSWETFLIDTPGMGDANRIDADHLLEMAKYIRNNDEAQAFVFVLNFNAPRLGNRERLLFELLSSMYSKSKWYKHIGVVWSRYYPSLPEELKREKHNRVEGFKRFMEQYFKDSVPPSEVSSIPHYFVDSVDARKPHTESNEELSKLVSWAEKLPTMAEDLPQIRVVEKKYTEDSTDVQNPEPYRTVTEHKQRDCTKFSDGSVECSEWRMVSRKEEHTKTFPFDTIITIY